MLKAVLPILCVLAAGTAVSNAARQGETGAASLSAAHRAVIAKYCVTCHNERLKTADLTLDKLNIDKVAEHPEVWEKVVRKLRTRAMPPAGAPRPDSATYDSLASFLETDLDRIAAATPNPGSPVAHRLNRAEYGNAIRDLLGLDIDAGSLLPADDSNYGFDNNADALAISPMIFERYVSAAAKVARVALGYPAIPAAVEKYTVPQLLVQDDRESEDLPFGSRGGMAVRHYFPADAEYTIRIRLQRVPDTDVIIGIADPHQVDLRLDGERTKLFQIGGEYPGKRNKLYNGADILDDANQRYLASADQGLEVRLQIKAGMHLIGVSFLKEPSVKLETVYRPQQAGFHFVQPDTHDLPYLDSISVGGPFNQRGAGDGPSGKKIFICGPATSSGARANVASGDATADEACAKKILSTLARRAYRRPVNDVDANALLNLYRSGQKDGGFVAGIGMALRAILVSPEFLFRVERDPAGVAASTAYRIGDLDLASRLSFFLWSSIPDDELLDVAARGKLKDPQTLEAQVRRMLADPRAKALVTDFAGQWLFLRNLKMLTPDRQAFPEYDDNLIRAFQTETEMFFESIIREDRSLLDLLSADYTFVNERLARHYGIQNVYGSRFRRVTLADPNRRGLLGQGSILTATSYANRTSPTERGKWILDNFLGAPPPPPPPNVPSLKENGENGKLLTMRQRMEQHRNNPVCASCHSRMDPLGFALENFDGMGKWRTEEANNRLDTSGALPDGTKFEGPAELRKVLEDRREQFVTAVAEKLMTYALGRGVEYYDASAVRAAVRDAGRGGYRWSALVMGIVKSVPFQMRRSKEL